MNKFVLSMVHVRVRNKLYDVDVEYTGHISAVRSEELRPSQAAIAVIVVGGERREENVECGICHLCVGLRSPVEEK